MLKKTHAVYVGAALFFAIGAQFLHAAGTKYINVGQDATISWSVGGAATACSPSFDSPATSGTVGSGPWNHWLNGQKYGSNNQGFYVSYGTNFSIPGTFTLRCTDNYNGSVSDATTIVVSCPSGTSWNGSMCAYPTPVVTASIAPSWVSYGGYFTSMSYSATHTSYCNIYVNGSPGWMSAPASYAWGETGPYYQTTTWTFTCYNPTGQYGSASVTLNVCPKGYNYSGGCVNPPPTVTISPGGSFFIPLNQPYVFSSNATDGSSDIVTHNMEWITPSGNYNWQGAPVGTVSYNNPTSYPNGTGNSNQAATFTPTNLGEYRVRFAAQDNTFSNYNGLGPRWTYSAWTTVQVINGVGVAISEDPANTTQVKWQCFNANRATLVTTNGPTTNDFANKTVPPASGTLAKSSGATYTITCTNTVSNESRSASYTVGVLGGDANFTISAYIRSTDASSNTYSSSQPLIATTPDGQFYDWSYRITNGTATSCKMEQKNDTSEWYPYTGYATNPVTYTQAWADLPSSERSSFASAYTNQHDWRITCFDSQGGSKSLIWSLQKTNAYPTVVDASLQLNCGVGSPYIRIQCANSDAYQVRNNSSGDVVSQGAVTSAEVTLPGDGTYSVVCKIGGINGTGSREVLRTYSSSMCAPQASALTATPRTINKGSATTLQWNISQPNSSCNLTAETVCTGGHSACSAQRIAAENALNQKIQTENTDANDPNNINNISRTVLNALRTEAYNNGVPGKALGKKTLRLDYTTDFTLSCGGNPQKVRVQVTNDNEG